MRFFISLIRNLLGLLLLPLRWLRRWRAAPSGAWLRLEIDGAITNVAPHFPFWDRRPRPLDLTALRRVIALSQADRRVQGWLVVLKSFHGGSATATAVRDRLLEIQRAGKRLAVYLPNGAGTREMYVASAAELVLVGPETNVAPLGFALEAEYFKDALDKLGVEPEVFARGRYKTAGEMLVSRAMSEPQREQIGALLDTAWEALIDALATGRSVERSRAEAWVDDGPWPARAAVEQGLANAVAYEDEIPRLLDPSRDKGAPIVAAAGYRRRREIRFRPLFARPRIGVVNVHGPIVSKSAVSLMPAATEEAVCGALNAARENGRVKGVVLHIDSRGGSAVASDRMLHEVQRLAAAKPVVACMQDAAASGGYMVAVGAHSIVAQPTTVTGSIGVIAARLVVRPLIERLGIAVEVVKRGARADMQSVARHLSDSERQALDRELDEVYQSFVDAVARGRRRSFEEIDALAGGRVWSGQHAYEHGLVDRLGGFDVALDELRAKIGPGSERLRPVLVTTRRAGGPVGLLPPILGRAASALGAGRFAERLELALATSREAAWLWCDTGEIDLG
jgi:protease IV